MISWCHSVEPILENIFLDISTSLVHNRKTLNHHANSENMGSLETSGTTIFGRFWPPTWRLSIVWATSWLFSGNPSSHCLWRLLSGSMAKTAPGTPYYVGILHSHCMACRLIFTQKLYLITLKVVWGPQLFTTAFTKWTWNPFTYSWAKRQISIYVYIVYIYININIYIYISIYLPLPS